MNCNDVQVSISEYIDDELGAPSQEVMFAHLAACDRCRQFLRGTLALRSGIAAVPLPEVPRSLDRRVMRLRPGRSRGVSGAGERIRRVWSHRLSVPLPSAALIALGLITVTVLSISLWQKPEVVAVPSLPAVDVYSGQATLPTNAE